MIIPAERYIPQVPKELFPCRYRDELTGNGCAPVARLSATRSRSDTRTGPPEIRGDGERHHGARRSTVS